jgi:hypothetical protein
VEAGRAAFQILKQLRPTSNLKTTKKNKDGTMTESERRYNPFSTRNCRYAGAFMLDLFDQGVDTNIVNTDMSERTNRRETKMVAESIVPAGTTKTTIVRTTRPLDH